MIWRMKTSGGEETRGVGGVKGGTWLWYCIVLGLKHMNIHLTIYSYNTGGYTNRAGLAGRGTWSRNASGSE